MFHPTEDETVEVRSVIDKNPSEMTVKIAENMGLPEVAVVEALPEYMRVAVPCENFESIWQEMNTWKKVTFIITNNGAIVEVVGKLPKGKFGHGFFEHVGRHHIFSEPRCSQGCNGIDLDVVLYSLDFKRIHKPNQRHLCCGIIGLTEISIKTGSRCGHDDPAETVFFHFFKCNQHTPWDVR